jgi:hypothetical protein
MAKGLLRKTLAAISLLVLPDGPFLVLLGMTQAIDFHACSHE